MKLINRTILVLLAIVATLVVNGCGGTQTVPPTTTPASTAKANLAPANSAPAAQPAQAQATPVPFVSKLTPVAGQGGVIAKVNGEVVKADEYNNQLVQAERFLTTQQGLDLSTDAGKQQFDTVREQVLNQLTDQILINQAATKLNVAVTDKQVDDEIAGLVARLGSQDELKKRMQDSGLDDTQLRKLIREQLQSDAVVNKVTENISTKAEQIHAEHILVSTQEDADKVLARLKAGEDFAKVAMEASTDPSAQTNGGDLGWFPRGMMVKEFEDAAFVLKPNETSGVIKSSFGFHIIRLLERDPAREVDSQLLDGLRQQAFGKWLDDQRSAAKIETFKK
ncbi:MAG: hypothetical protein EXR62_13540 [Chloroflexi bacterium]|nr:hypothetical protein [Chloroflexota bacterium]